MANRINDWQFRQWTESWTRNDLTEEQRSHIEAAKAWDHAQTAAKVALEFDDTNLEEEGINLEIKATQEAYRASEATREFLCKDNLKKFEKLMQRAKDAPATDYRHPRAAQLTCVALRKFHQNQVRKTDDQKYKDDIAWRVKWGVVPIGPPPIWESKINYVEGVDPERFTIRRDENTKAYVLEDKVKGREVRRFNWLPTQWDIEAIMEFYKTN